MPPRRTEYRILLPPEAWDFSRVPPEERQFCSIYEHALNTDWFRDAIVQWRTQLPTPGFVETGGAVDFMGRYQDALDEANLHRPQGLSALPDFSREFAEAATLAFPFFPEKHWLSLDRREIRIVQHLAISNLHLEEGYETLCTMMIAAVQYDRLPAWLGDAETLKRDLERTELYLFRIPEGTSRQQAITAFEKWIDFTGRFPNTRGARRSSIFKNTPDKQLRSLAIWRLMKSENRIRPLHILVDLAQSQCRVTDWLPAADNKWHQAQNDAIRFAEKLFPLPGQRSPPVEDQ